MQVPNANLGLEVVVENLVRACNENNHLFCGNSMKCTDLVSLFSSSRGDLESVGQTWKTKNAQPSHSWSTSQLMRCVKDLLLGFPDDDPYRRATFITTALARLGERGFSPDAVLRTGFGQLLVNRILFVYAQAYRNVSLGKWDLERVPRNGWVKALQADQSLRKVDSSELARVLVLARRGNFDVVAKKWLKRASTTHLVDWKIDDYLHSPPGESELILPLGHDATVWLCERFTNLYFDEWSIESLTWELAFIHSPKEISDTLGIELKYLLERRFSLDVVSGALAHRLSQPAQSWEKAAIEARDQCYEDTLRAIENDDIEKAIEIARKGVWQSPLEPRLQSALAFCLIPFSPHESIQLSKSVLGNSYLDGDDDLVNSINLLSAEIMIGNSVDLKEVKRLAQLAENFNTERKAWFWNPKTLTTSAKIMYVQPIEWFREYFRMQVRI